MRVALHPIEDNASHTTQQNTLGTLLYPSGLANLGFAASTSSHLLHPNTFSLPTPPLESGFDRPTTVAVGRHARTRPIVWRQLLQAACCPVAFAHYQCPQRSLLCLYAGLAGAMELHPLRE